MYYDLLSLTRPKARKQYRCVWCWEPVLQGEVHVHEVGVFDGDFQDDRWHNECHVAADEFFHEDGGVAEFSPGEFKRGTTDLR